MLDVIGGDVQTRSIGVVRPGSTLVTIANPPTVQPADGRAVFFVVEADRAQLAEIAERVRAGRLRTIIGKVVSLADAPAAFDSTERVPGKTIVRVVE